jgi:hypothetical protein
MMEYQSLAIQGQALPVGFNEWLAQGRELYARRKELEWECADWLSTGLDKFPDQMTLALQEFACDPIEQKALVRTARVAAKLPASQRNAALTFAHHAHVADLPVDDRLELLKRAETENLSARAMRIVSLERKAQLNIGNPQFEDDDWEYRELMAIIHAWNRARQDARQSFYDMAGDAELGIIEA